MSWIRIAGQGLEFSGKIIQSASFEAWAESKGKEIIEKTVRQGVTGWFGNNQGAARKALWEDLKLVTLRPALHATLSRLAADYVATLARVAEVFESNKYTANNKTYVIPRFVVNPLHRATLEQALSASDEFQNLKGGPLLQSYFYDEFLGQLDAAFATLAPRPDNPVRLDRSSWYAVGRNDSYDWRATGETWRGHVFVHGSTTDLSERKAARLREDAIREQIALLDDQMGRFSREQKQDLAAAWVQMRDSLVAGEKVRSVPALKTGR